jgi:hypothetical protein
MSELTKAALDADETAARLARADVDPTITVGGWLHPVGDIGRALGDASDTAYRLASATAGAITDPALSGAAEQYLREASKRTARASDWYLDAAAAMRRTWQRAGEELPGYLPDSRAGKAARAAAIDFASLSRMADGGAAALSLDGLCLAVSHYGYALASLAAIGDQLPKALFYAYDRLPRGLNLKASQATGPVRSATATTRKASAAALRAVSQPMRQAADRARRQAALPQDGTRR